MAMDREGFIITTLERISDKLDKHEDKIDGVKEDVNKFVTIFEKMANMEERHEAKYLTIKETVDRNNKIVHKRIDTFEEDIKKQVAKIISRQETTGCPAHQLSVTHYDEMVKQSVEDRLAFKTDIQTLKDKPSKRWDTIVTTLITAVVVGVVGFVIGGKQ